MKLSTAFRFVTVVGLFLLLVTLFLTPSQQLMAQESTSEGSVTPLGAVGTAFTYQGRLSNSSGPMTGVCDFNFSLWSAAANGNPIGSVQAGNGVHLNEGNFSVALDFGANIFEGQARYLQIAVRCPAGSGSYTNLNG